MINIRNVLCHKVIVTKTNCNIRLAFLCQNKGRHICRGFGFPIGAQMPLRVCLRPPIRHSPSARIKIRTPRHFSRSRFLHRAIHYVRASISTRGWRSRAYGKTRVLVLHLFVAQPRPFARKQCSRYAKECGISRGRGTRGIRASPKKKRETSALLGTIPQKSPSRAFLREDGGGGEGGARGEIPSPFIGFFEESRRHGVIDTIMNNVSGRE